MASLYKRIRGTRDVLPTESSRWQYVERLALEVASNAGFFEMRTPTIEKTELFTRSVGETTDVVQKEMYTFQMGRDSITLRPEGTAGAARAVVENGLLSEPMPIKIVYLTSCFRHENPQAGRYRQHHQFGLEYYGSQGPSAEVEVISVAKDWLFRLGLGDILVNINSIGCPKCRPGYYQKLLEYYTAREDEICDTCRERMRKNPLRLLDCKVERCHQIALDAPKSLECLCEECAEHFEGLKKRLDAVEISYQINPMIVRGLDYYTKTVFEFLYTKDGSPYNGLALGGGGRYDGLLEQLGAQPTPGLGYGIGLERILLVMEEEGCDFPDRKPCDLYLGSMGEEESIRALTLATALRQEGFQVLCDTVGRSVKAQMKYADKIGAAYSCILGSNELERGEGNIKNMQTGESKAVALTCEALSAFLYDCLLDSLSADGQGNLADILSGLLDKGE